MLCQICGKEIEDGVKFCTECGTVIENEAQPTPENKSYISDVAECTEDKPIDVFKVTRIIAKGYLSVHSDRVEFSYVSDNKSVTEIYHYFNIKSISVDNGLKIASLLIETIDDNKMFFTMDGENSVEIYNQKSEIINQAKTSCPTLDALGLNEEDMKKELADNTEKRKGKAGKKILNFLSEYKNFGTLNQKNKIIHIAVPILVVILLFSLFSGGGVSDDDYIDCAISVASNHLKSPSTASYSDAKVVEKDDYGRVLVTFSVDSQNGFGAYVRTYCAIVIESYDKSTENFTYNRSSFQTWTDRSHEEICIEGAKIFGNWDEPIED